MLHTRNVMFPFLATPPPVFSLYSVSNFVFEVKTGGVNGVAARFRITIVRAPEKNTTNSAYLKIFLQVIVQSSYLTTPQTEEEASLCANKLNTCLLGESPVPPSPLYAACRASNSEAFCIRQPALLRKSSHLFALLRAKLI